MPRRAPQAERVTPEPAAHGDYRLERVAAPDGSISRVQRNHGGSTVARWRSAGELTDAQFLATQRYAQAWRRCFGSASVTMNYDPTASIRSTGMPLGNVDADLAAKRFLDLVDADLSRLPARYRLCFHAAVVDNRSAAEAGKDLADSPKARAIAGRTVVQLVADMIAA